MGMRLYSFATSIPHTPRWLCKEFKPIRTQISQNHFTCANGKVRHTHRIDTHRNHDTHRAIHVVQNDDNKRWYIMVIKNKMYESSGLDSWLSGSIFSDSRLIILIDMYVSFFIIQVLFHVHFLPATFHSAYLNPKGYTYRENVPSSCTSPQFAENQNL